MSNQLESWLVQHPKLLGALTTLTILLASAGNALATASASGTRYGP